MLFTSLATLPEPETPTCTTCSPSALITGMARFTAASSPPIMMVSVPLIERAGPPLTGASTKCMPAAFALASNSCDSFGSLVERSTMVTPALGAASICPTTALTAAGSGNDMATTSHCATKSATDFPATAPLATIAATLAGTMSNTRTGTPADNRYVTMGWPMLPRPI